MSHLNNSAGCHSITVCILQLGCTWIASCQRPWYSTEISCDLHLFFHTDTLNGALTIPLQSFPIRYTFSHLTSIKLQLIQCQPDSSCNELHIWTSLYHHWSVNINRNIYKYRHSKQVQVQSTNVFEKWNAFIHTFISIQPWRPGLAGTRAQSCERYGSGTLHPGQVLGGSLPLLSPFYTLWKHKTLCI